MKLTGPENDGTFENLEVWKDAIELAVRVYALFRECKDWGFRGRSSNAEFIRFLDIARGSCGEVRSQTHIALRVGLLDGEDAARLIAEAKRLSKRIARLMEVRRTDFK